jgi:hypothetical protein
MFDDDLIQYNDVVTLKQRTGEDDWQKTVYGSPIVIPHVRVDRGTIYSGTNNNRQIVASAVIYMRLKENPEMPAIDETWLQGVAEIDGKPYTITTVNVLADPGMPVIWGYELEVL